MRTTWGLLALLWIWLAAACGDNKVVDVGVTSLELTPAAPTIATGTSVQMTATAILATGTARDVTAEASWSSADTDVATVDASGNVTGVAGGTAQISASYGGVEASVAVTVTTGALVAIEVTPTNPSLALGTERQLTATGRFADNSTQDLSTQVTWTVDNANVSVDAAGLATGAAVGESVVTATFDGLSGSTTVTVTDAVLVAIDITPAAPSLAKGTTQQLAATGRFSDASVQDLTNQVTWATTNMIVAIVESTGLARAMDAGTTTILATLGGVQGSTTITVTAATLVSIEVAPANSSIPLGVQQQMAATGTFTDNTTQDLTATAVWSSTAAASVSNAAGEQGLVTPIAIGMATITATVGTVSGSTIANITDAALVSIAVEPVDPTVADGLTQPFVAVGTFSDNTTRAMTAQVTWTYSDESIAVVSNAAGSEGLATAIDPGTATITATSGSISGSTTLTVTTATLASIQITPVDQQLARGLSLPFTATGTFTDNTTQNLTTQVTWSSTDDTVAAISNAAGSEGVATALALGTVVITATSGNISATTSLQVTAASLVSIAITPASPSVARGRELQLIATGTFSDNTTQNLTTQVTWSSADATIATVSNTTGSEGLARGVDAGSVTIRATSGSVVGQTTLTVTAAVLESIAITPPSPTTVSSGFTVQLTATGTFSDNSTQNLTTQVTWSSSAATTAEVSNAQGTEGVVTGRDPGMATVTATLGSVSASTTIEVTAATLVSLEVTPANASSAKGTTRQFTATGVFSDNSRRDLTTQVAWASSDTAVAQISSAAGSEGLASALDAGTVTITATLGSESATTTFTVTPAELASIRVTPANNSMPRGTTQQYTATGVFTDTTQLDLTTQVTWSSTDADVANVSNAAPTQGLVTATNAGATQIRATSGTIVGSTGLTVTAAALVSIRITPVAPSVPDGLTQQFIATGTFTDATTEDITTQVTWESSDTAVATISNATGSQGLASSVDPGTTTITATSGAISDTETLTVTAATLVSIRITPDNPSFDEGTTQQLTATGQFTDSTSRDMTSEVTWASGDANIVTVSNAAATAGQATGVSPGMTQVTATSGTIVGSTNVTIAGVPPTVTATSPDAGATNVSPTASFSITFSRPMRLSSLTTQATSGACTGAIQVSTDNFASCIALSSIALSPTGTIATFAATPALAFGTTYQIRVTTEATSSSGIAMTAAFTQSPGFSVELDGCPDHLVISQVYGGGGNTGAPLNRDFIEIHNPTGAAVDLTGFSVQYTSASATGTVWQVTALSGTIDPGEYYLIGQASGTNGGPLPAVDTGGSTAMSATAGKVALVNSTTALSGACPTGAQIVDFVGYGTAVCFETAPTAAPSNTRAVVRARFGNRDTNDNSNDFQVLAPDPRNSSSEPTFCSANESGLATEADFCVLQHPPATTTASGSMTELIYARIFESGVTEAAGANATVRAQIGYGPVGTNPQSQAGWTWSNATFNVQTGNDDEYQVQLLAPAAGTYRYTARFSLDGSNWTYCDLNGAGSNAGLAFDPSNLGTWTVN